MNSLRDLAQALMADVVQEDRPEALVFSEPRPRLPIYTPDGGTNCTICVKPMKRGGCLRCKICKAAICHNGGHNPTFHRAFPKEQDTPCPGSASVQAAAKSFEAQPSSAEPSTNAKTTPIADETIEQKSLPLHEPSSASTMSASAPTATEAANPGAEDLSVAAWLAKLAEQWKKQNAGGRCASCFINLHIVATLRVVFPEVTGEQHILFCCGGCIDLAFHAIYGRWARLRQPYVEVKR